MFKEWKTLINVHVANVCTAVVKMYTYLLWSVLVMYLYLFQALPDYIPISYHWYIYI